MYGDTNEGALLAAAIELQLSPGWTVYDRPPLHDGWTRGEDPALAMRKRQPTCISCIGHKSMIDIIRKEGLERPVVTKKVKIAAVVRRIVAD